MWILILVLSTHASHYSGATTAQMEFSSSETCTNALKNLTKTAQERGNYILTQGCFKK